MREPTGWQAVANEIAGLDRVLCIVNTRKDARQLGSDAPRPRSEVANISYISTNMCAEHRRSAYLGLLMLRLWASHVF